MSIMKNRKSESKRISDWKKRREEEREREEEEDEAIQQKK